MEIEEAIRTYLLTNSALTALIGQRILPDDISDGASLPCVVYKKISDIKQHTHQGQISNENPIFQYSIYSQTKAAAINIKNIVKTALCDYKGTLSGLIIQYVTLLNEFSSLQVSDNGLSKSYIEDLEFQINFIRS